MRLEEVLIRFDIMTHGLGHDGGKGDIGDAVSVLGGKVGRVMKTGGLGDTDREAPMCGEEVSYFRVRNAHVFLFTANEFGSTKGVVDFSVQRGVDLIESELSNVMEEPGGACGG